MEFFAIVVESSLSAVKVSEGLTVDWIFESWEKIKPVIMEAWDEDRDALIDLFGKVRVEMIGFNKDITTWIGANQGCFAEASLREIAGVTIPSERIYGLGTRLVLAVGPPANFHVVSYPDFTLNQ